jgi:hypothetical protein
MMRKRFPSRSERNTASAAFEKLDLANGFHIAQAFACGGQGEPHFRSAVRNASGVGNGDEKAKVCKVETHACLSLIFCLR